MITRVQYDQCTSRRTAPVILAAATVMLADIAATPILKTLVTEIQFGVHGLNKFLQSGPTWRFSPTRVEVMAHRAA
jgi:hypothetical protein